MNFREWVFDRIEDSFTILFKSIRNFFSLVWPIFIYKLVFGIFIWNFISYVLLWNVNSISTDIFSSPYYIIIFFLLIIWFILYITFLVWFILAIIKSIQDLLDNKNINYKKNLKYGFDSIIPSFNTYWYIFEYIVIIPFYIISAWGFLFILWSFIHNWIFSSYWLKILFFWFFVLFVFMIYRWVKINFSIVSAVDENSYTKTNFKKSVFVTNNNWWRIVWNFILLSILLSIIFWIIWFVTWMFSTWIFDVIDVKDIFTKYLNHNLVQSDIDNIKTNIMNFYNSFYLNNFIVSIFDLFFSMIKLVFILIFTYIFYERLKLERFWKLDNKKDIEL